MDAEVDALIENARKLPPGGMECFLLFVRFLNNNPDCRDERMSEEVAPFMRAGDVAGCKSYFHRKRLRIVK